MLRRQKSTTNYPIVFLLVSSSDLVTGITGASPTVTISKNGGAFAAASGAVTEVGNGVYALAGNATDRGTLGTLALHATATGAIPIDLLVEIVDYDPFAYGAYLDIAVSSRLAKTEYTAPDNASVTAIKAKTDNLPAAPASAGDVAAVPAGVWALADWGALVSQIWGAAVRTLTYAGSYTVISPAVDAGGELTLYRGDDYLAANGRSIDWTIDAVGAGASGAVSMLGQSFAVSFPSATVARLELTHADTAALSKGSSDDYRLVVVDADGRVSTVCVGSVRAL